MKRLLLLFLNICCTMSMTAQISDYITELTSPIGFAQSGTTLFVADVGSSKIQKIDMTATNPVAEDFVNNVSFATKMVIIGNDLYFTLLNSGGVSKVDITVTDPPVIPVVSGIISPFGLVVKDNFMYVTSRSYNDGRIIRFDYTQTNPTLETLITGLPGILNDIDIYGNNLYMSRGSLGISKIDISQPNPVVEDVIEANGVLEVFVKDNYLYYSNDYIFKIDLLDAIPNPELIVSNIGLTWDLHFDGDDILMAQQNDHKISKLKTTFVDPTLSPDYNALVNLYNNTDGANWTNSGNWLDPTISLYSWHGVMTDENNKVISINLNSNNLTGNFPPEISDLDQLKTLNFYSNMLTGDLPNTLYNSTNLESLEITANNFTGTISSSIANLSNLSSLSIGSNEFTGTIPSELGNLTNLTFLNLATNNFQGTLPSSLSNLINLTNISMSQNNFEGVIPFNSPNANIFATENNYDFSDLEPFILANNFAVFNYSPQLTPDQPEAIIIPPTQNVTFTLDDTNINRESENQAMNNEYQWFKDDIAISGANSNTYEILNVIVSDSGIYHCEITNTIVPGLIIVRADIVLTVDENLSIIESETNSFKMYPNPVNNWLTIDLGNQTNAKIILHDVSGKLVLEQKTTSNIHVLDTSSIQSGVYMVTIGSEENTITKRFIKQ